MLKRIIYISPGPTFKPHDPSYQKTYKILSKYFSGYILTTSRKSEEIQIDKFRYVSMKSDFSIRSTVEFALFCLRYAYKILREDGSVDLVSTYDPLKTGMIGAAVAKLHNAKFAPEVNGVYTSNAEWLDEKENISTFLRKFLYPRIMGFVLGRAAGVRLLFKEQIEPFKDIVAGKIVKDFRLFVDIDRFKSYEEKKEVLFVGFPFKRKGVDVLIKAFKKIAPKYPDWKLKILGWFPDPKELQNAIAGHSQIFHKKPVHYSEMPEQIGSCAILALPSRSEAMGRVLLEAMACGKPRIGSKVDGIPMVINDGVDGLLCRPGDVDDLALKLDLLMGDKELRKKMGDSGRLRAINEFSYEVYIKNLIGFYNAVACK